MEEIRSKELDDIQMIDHIKIKQIESKKKQEKRVKKKKKQFYHSYIDSQNSEDDVDYLEVQHIESESDSIIMMGDDTQKKVRNEANKNLDAPIRKRKIVNRYDLRKEFEIEKYTKDVG